MLQKKWPYLFSALLVSAVCTHAADKPTQSKSTITGKATVKTEFTSVNGKNVKKPKIEAHVLIRSADAAKAFAWGHVKWGKALDGTGKPLKFKPAFLSMDDPTKHFLRVKRGGYFDKHPKDGVAVAAELDPAGREVKAIKLLSGTVKLRIANGRKTWLAPVSKLKVPAGTRGESAYVDAAVKKLGYTLKVQAREMSVNGKKSPYYSFAFVDSTKRPDLVDKIEFLNSKKMPFSKKDVEANGGRMTMNTIRHTSVDLDAANLAKVRKFNGYLRISLFDKVTEKVVPFKVENVKITKDKFGF